MTFPYRTGDIPDDFDSTMTITSVSIPPYNTRKLVSHSDLATEELSTDASNTISSISDSSQYNKLNDAFASLDADDMRLQSMLGILKEKGICYIENDPIETLRQKLSPYTDTIKKYIDEVMILSASLGKSSLDIRFDVTSMTNVSNIKVDQSNNRERVVIQLTVQISSIIPIKTDGEEVHVKLTPPQQNAFGMALKKDIIKHYESLGYKTRDSDRYAANTINLYWGDDEFARQLEELSDISQVETFTVGVPLTDIVA